MQGRAELAPCWFRAPNSPRLGKTLSNSEISWKPLPHLPPAPGRAFLELSTHGGTHLAWGRRNPASQWHLVRWSHHGTTGLLCKWQPGLSPCPPRPAAWPLGRQRMEAEQEMWRWRGRQPGTGGLVWWGEGCLVPSASGIAPTSQK